jgi:hypothetical protein
MRNKNTPGLTGGPDSVLILKSSAIPGPSLKIRHDDGHRLFLKAEKNGCIMQ